MPTYKTPDVYVEEISVFPPSVAEVETAIPAFVGYTETLREIAPGDLLNKPRRIKSLLEYETLSGEEITELLEKGKIDRPETPSGPAVVKPSRGSAIASKYWSVS